MKQLVAICCCCEKVRDDVGTESGGAMWQDFRIYMAMHMLRAEEIMLSHGYCPDCLSFQRDFLASPTRVISRHATERGA